MHTIVWLCALAAYACPRLEVVPGYGGGLGRHKRCTLVYNIVASTWPVARAWDVRLMDVALDAGVDEEQK